MADRLKEIRERFALRDERGSMLTVGDFECLLRVAVAAEAYQVIRTEYFGQIEKVTADMVADMWDAMNAAESTLFAALDGLKGGWNG